MNELLSFGGWLDQPEILVVKFLLAAGVGLAATLAIGGVTGLRRLVDSIDRILFGLSQIIIVALMLLLTIAIFGRATYRMFLGLGLPGLSVPDSSIMSEIMMMAIVFFAVGNAQKIGAHIEVTAVTNLLPARLKLAFHVFALTIGILIMGGAAWFSAVRAAADYYSHAFIFSSVLYLVEWPGRTLVPLGLAWWTLRMMMQAVIPAERYGQTDQIQDRLDKVG